MSEPPDRLLKAAPDRHLFDARMTAGLFTAAITYPLLLQVILTVERLAQRLYLHISGSTILGAVWQIFTDGIGLLFGGVLNALTSVIPSVVVTMVVGAMVWVAANMVVSITRLRIDSTCFAASVVGWTGFLATFGLVRIMAPDFSTLTAQDLMEFLKILALGPALATVVGQACGAIRTWPDDPRHAPSMSVRFSIGQLLTATLLLALFLAVLKLSELMDPVGLVIIAIWLVFQGATLWIILRILHWRHLGHRLRDVPRWARFTPSSGPR